MTIQELRAAVRSARTAMEQATAETFEEARRSYDVALRDYQEAIAERGAQTQEAMLVSRAALINEGAKEIVRNAKKAGVQQTVAMRSAAGGIVTSAADIVNAGFPITIGELLEPLELPTIYDKVGIKISTGVKGQLIWPALTSLGEVTVAGTEVQDIDSAAVDFGKVTATPYRMAIVVEMSYESINDASFDLVGTLTKQMHNKLARAINAALVDKYGAITGPFASTKTKKTIFAGTMPTYKELLGLKGNIAKSGADMRTFSFIINPVTYSELEATPITEGDSRMIIQAGKIGGYPVYQDNGLADGEVKAGSFAYVAANQHGEALFIVDPYTKASQNTIRFILSADWSMTTLREVAFIYGKPKTA